MSRVEKGRRVQLTYQEKGPTGRPTLIVDVSAEDDILPHEHRENIRDMTAAVLGVPLESLEGVEVELKRTPDGHEHPHPHPHPEVKVAPKPIVLPPKAKA